jgi:hypothetical protein
MVIKEGCILQIVTYINKYACLSDDLKDGYRQSQACPQEQHLSEFKGKVVPKE